MAVPSDTEIAVSKYIKLYARAARHLPTQRIPRCSISCMQQGQPTGLDPAAPISEYGHVLQQDVKVVAWNVEGEVS